MVAVLSVAAFLAAAVGGVTVLGAPIGPVPERIPLAGRFSGSAFAVAPGLLVTNAHVTMRCRLGGLPLSVVGHDGPWVIHAEDPTLDLALIAGPARAPIPSIPLSAAQRIVRGTSVLLLGFPMDAGDGHAPGTQYATPGTVQRAALTVHQPEGGSSTSFYITDRAGRDMEPTWEDGIAYFGAENADRLRWVVEIAAPTGRGGSGGPVVDGNGSVVAVVFAGAGPTGQTSAVPLSDLRDFLRRAGVMPNFAPPAPAQVNDWRPAFAAVHRSVVRVRC